MEYKITKENCQEHISGVCSRCGGIIEPLETVDNSGDPTFWAGCSPCHTVDNGVSPKIFDIAKHLVTKEQYKYYSFIEDHEDDSKEQKEYNLGCQISGTCSIVRRVLAASESL